MAVREAHPREVGAEHGQPATEDRTRSPGLLLGAPASRTGKTAATEKVKLLQALSITQRENARAVVRRTGWDAATAAGLDQP